MLSTAAPGRSRARCSTTRQPDSKCWPKSAKIQVDLVDKVLFESGKAELSPHGQEVLTRLAAVLAKVDKRQFHVSGHTDSMPPAKRIADDYPTNWELSGARAVNVVRFLEEKGSVPGKRLVAAAGPKVRENREAFGPAGEIAAIRRRSR